MWRPSNFREPSAIQRDAIRLVGGREVIRDGFVSVEPAYGLQVLRSVMDCVREEDTVATDRIIQELNLNGPGQDLLFTSKMVVRAPSEEGGRLRMVPRIPGLTDDALSNYTATSDGDGIEECEVREERALTYKLNTLFTDTTLQDKLQLSTRRMQAARRVATSDAGAAARSLTEAIQARGFPRCVVVAGDYAKSVTRAKDFIHKYADTVEYRDTAAPSVVLVDKIHMTYDAFTGTKLWTVEGPLKYAVEIQCVYQIAIHHGPQHTMFLLGLETAQLNINISNAETGEYYFGSVQGYSSLKGITPMSADLPSELTAEQASSLYRASAKVLPVTYDGAVVGSAVRVSDRHVVLNAHTINTVSDVGGTAVVAGEDVITSHSLAFDLSVVDRKGGQAQWTLRDPTVGEKVVLIYSVGDSVEYTEVLRVLSVHQDSMVLSQSNVLRKGASGAVVVALKDFALLGLFVSVRARSVVCASFSSRHLTQVTEADSVCMSADAGEGGDEVGPVTYTRMLHHGLGSYLDAINSSVCSVYTKTGTELELAGTVANYAGQWRTTVDARRAQLYMQDKQPLLFQQVAADSFVCKNPPPVLTEVPATRSVVPGERVCVLARAGGEVVMSKFTRVAHYTVGAKIFTVEDVGDTSELLEGGLVISERDACVLGQYVRRQDDAFGESCAVCLAVPVNDIGLGVVVPEVGKTSNYEVCVDLLTSDEVFEDQEKERYEALGRNALDIVVSQLNRKGFNELVDFTVEGVDVSAVSHFCQSLTDVLGISAAMLVSPDKLFSRYVWLLGYMFVEHRSLFDKHVKVLFGLPVVSDDSPRSATTARAFSRAGTPRFSRAYSSEIENLQAQVDLLKQMIRDQ